MDDDSDDEEVETMALVKDVARADAEKALADHWHSGHFPVDVEQIAERIGIRVEETYLREGVSGMLQVQQGQTPVIYVDAREPRVRQQFTIAHELGHYTERVNRGHKDFSFVDRRGASYDLHEFYADEFAGNLLMPEPEIRRLKGEGRTNSQIAAHFGVSPTAVLKRLERLAAHA